MRMGTTPCTWITCSSAGPSPNGNTEPFVGDEESLNVGWFSPDALPEPLAATTVERMAYVREYLKAKANGDSHAQFAFNGTIR